jgi:hypothetical protein
VTRIAKEKHPRKDRRIVLGTPDGRITPRAGLHLVAKLNALLSITGTIDAVAPQVKQRRRGLRLGEIVVSLAETMLAGGDFLVDLDHHRNDAAGLGLRAVPEVPASTTVIGIGKRFDAEARRGVERANALLVGTAFARLPAKRRAGLAAERPTIDLDPTTVEVYGRMKEGTAFNYQGQRTYRPHPAIWAEAGWALAADLGSGRSDPRPQAPSLIKRAVAALPCGLGRPIVRADSGFFSGDVARAAIEHGADFAIAAKRTGAVWRKEREIPDGTWHPAKGMEAEVAPCDYVPAGWPPGTRTICRRVKVHRDEVSGDTRSRRRRTIDPHQLMLLEAGETEVAYAYSFIVTNLTGDICDIEAWFRVRALVEEKLKDGKLGLALRHLPSGYEAVNAMWMWSALIGLNISSWLQALTGHDETDGRAHGKRLRRELVCVAARVTRHGRRLEVHCAPEHHDGAFADAWAALDTLLATASP